MYRFATILLIISLLFGIIPPWRALADIKVLEPQVDYTFGGQIIFRVNIQSDTPLKKIQVFFRSEGDTSTIGETATINSQGEAVYVYDLTHQPLLAFSKIDYWFTVTPQTGVAFTSPVYSFFYEDNRFNWQVLQENSLRVHWYEGNISFGRSVLDSAQRGLQRIQSLISSTTLGEIDIYVYANAFEMQSASRLGGVNWIAGHADPELGVMMASLPSGPDQLMETQRQVPHELMHIIMYRSVGQGYQNLPVWLKEGLASAVELNPNPDYQRIVIAAIEKGTWIPMASLCQSFPSDASNAFLAYAESALFTRYLHGQSGTSGLQALVKNYANGLDCERGTEAVLGSSLSQLEKQWKQEAFSENNTLDALVKLIPWLILLASVLVVPIILSLVGIRQKRRDPVKRGISTKGV